MITKRLGFVTTLLIGAGWGCGGSDVDVDRDGQHAAGAPSAGSDGQAGHAGDMGIAGSTGGSDSQAGFGGSAGVGGSAGQDRPAGAGGSAGAGGGEVDLLDLFEDPGPEPWRRVTAENVAAECNLDPDLLAAADARIGANYVVVRHGKLCHEYLPTGSDTPSEVWSTTKTLGALTTGIASYQTRDYPRTGPRTGQLSDADRVNHWLPNFSFHDADARVAHVLAMIAHNEDLSYGNRMYAYDTVGTVQIDRLNDMIAAAIAQEPARLGTTVEQFVQRFVFGALGMTQSSWSLGAPNKSMGFTWHSTVHDMARVGLLILHRGIWNGERLVDEGWTYKMTHPAFEDANTGYGYLTWLNTRSGGAGSGGAGSGSNTGDPCAPPALWPHYPHGLSEAPDCLYRPPHTCEQEHDVGVWSAQGLFGQFIVGHPGLDLVLVAKNYGGGGAIGLWNAVRPALVARDPVYAGDETAFCEAYGNNRYAPDLIVPMNAPLN